MLYKRKLIIKWYEFSRIPKIGVHCDLCKFGGYSEDTDCYQKYLKEDLTLNSLCKNLKKQISAGKYGDSSKLTYVIKTED